MEANADIKLRALPILEYLLKNGNLQLMERIESLIHNEEPVVGFDPSGNPISKADLLASLHEAESDIEAGRVLSRKEMESRFLNG